MCSHCSNDVVAEEPEVSCNRLPAYHQSHLPFINFSNGYPLLVVLGQHLVQSSLVAPVLAQFLVQIMGKKLAKLLHFGRFPGQPLV